MLHLIPRQFVQRARLLSRQQPPFLSTRFHSNRTMATTPESQKPFVSKTKHFMKKYGYVGIGVYCILGAIDLTAVMAVISVKGAERVREVEDYVIGKAKGWLGIQHTPRLPGNAHERPSFTSLFVIAYGIHKTILLPFRLSLTAAITPTVAKRLKHWGWLRNKLAKNNKK